ncbi:hypothetical protein AXF04_06250 [Staphylococcus aureus]|nr:hypothetical protein [Staphylococcus aureus]OZX11147.1 hypothetical protein AFP01_02795 [Staphylococcus aureus]PSH77727.1 hypothetical protein C7J94_07160 [Staphylococcus aureus]PZH54555.1 hypothetical protein C7Q95_06685 [Staphylococcus aureus]PZJ21602.1 hypothetical protein C7Q07_04425 [Staphylococcus aureus]
MMIESGTSQCPRLYNVILAGPQHREIGTPISTGNGSWGRGPTQRNWNPNFNRQWKLGTGPNTEADGKSDFNNVRVGVNEFNFVKISFLSHSLCMSLIMYSYF